MPVEGFCVAFDDATLEPDPTWTRLDDKDAYPGLSLQSLDIDRGKDEEEEVNKTGEGRAVFIDTAGTLDPTNPDGPFYGKLDPTKQVAFALWNPVALEYKTLFRGFVSDWNYDYDVTAQFATVTIEFVDLSEIMAALEMTPGNQGGTPPSGAEGNIFFAGGVPNGIEYGPSVFKHVNQRIIEALNDAGVPPEWQNIFSGNVTVQAAVYDRHDSLLQVVNDAVEAEFPGGVATAFVDKEGVFRFKGRFPPFFPDRPRYDITTYKVGDILACEADDDVALIAGLSFRRSRKDIVNACSALPQGVDPSDVPDGIVTDPTSIATHGWRVKSFPDLLTYQGHDDDGNTLDAITETARFAEYEVANKKDPKTIVSAIEFRPRDPEDVDLNAAAWWDLVCNAELGDLIAPLKTTHVGGGGFDEDFHMVGLSYHIEPLNDEFLDVTLRAQVAPTSFFEFNPFGEIPDNNDMAGAFVLPGSIGETAGNSRGFSNEGDDPVAASSKDPVAQTFTSLFTGPGGDYGDEATDTHNFRTAWYRWTVPGDWTASSSVGFALTGQTKTSCLLVVKCGPSGVPPDNADFTALGSGGAVNTPGSQATLTQTESGTANIGPGDDVYIGVGSMEDDGGDFSVAWQYLP